MVNLKLFKENILLFGGSFDPPHLGHLFAIYNALSLGCFKELWLIPTPNSRYDKKTQESEASRIAMIKLFCHYAQSNNHTRGDIKLKTDQITEQSLRSGRTNDLIAYYSSKGYNYDKLSFLIGADRVATIPTWYNYEELSQKIKFLIVPREGVTSAKIEKAKIYYLKGDYPSCNISSSMVRKLIREKKPYNYLITKEVFKYIKERNLYV